MPIIDTMKLKTNFIQANMPDDQATAIVEALATAETEQLATKADIESVRGDIKALYAKINVNQWVLGFLFAAMIVGLGMVFSQQQRLAAIETTLGQIKTAVEALAREHPAGPPPR